MSMHHNKGFTLIELMITVAIVAMLASIALPNYSEYVRKSARTECQATMTAAASAFERRRTAINTYVAPTGQTTLPGPQQCPADGSGATYTLAAVADASTFTITATAAGSQAADKCKNLTLSSAGTKGNSAGLSVSECWR